MDIYKNIRVNDTITRIYDKWITTDHLNSQFRSYSLFHPSDIGYCLLKAVLMRMNFPGKFYTLPKMQRTFENGHSTHERLQRHLGEIGILQGRWKCYNCHSILGLEHPHGIKRPVGCDVCNKALMRKAVIDDDGNIVSGPKVLFEYIELPVYDEKLEISGHTDGVLNINNNLFVIDFKTCSKSVYEELERKKVPMEAHIYQVNIYMYLLGINAGILFYENKNSLDIKEFLLVLDNDIINEFQRRVSYGIECYRNKTIPDIPEYLIPETDDYRDLKFSCQGYPAPFGSVKYPPCPFIYHCFSKQYEQMGGDKRMEQLYVKVNSRCDNED